MSNIGDFPFRPLVISMKPRQFESTKGPLELLVLKPQGLLFQDTCQKHMNFQIFQHLFYTLSLYSDDNQLDSTLKY